MSASNGRPASVRTVAIGQALRRRPLLVFGVPAVLLLATLAFVLLMRPVYESSVSLRVDEDRGGGVLAMLSTLTQGSEVFTEMAVLESRSLAEDVVRSLALQLSVEEPARVERARLFSDLSVDSSAPAAVYRFERTGSGRVRVSGDLIHEPTSYRPFARSSVESRDFGEHAVGEPIALAGATVVLGPEAAEHEAVVVTVLRFADAVTALQSDLEVSRPDREADVMLARFRGHDPDLVRAVPNELAAHFLARRQQVQTADARGTAAFLTEQIDTLNRNLLEAEENLRGFREENRIVSAEAEADAQVERLAGLQAQRDMMAVEREALGTMLAEVAQERPDSGAVSPYRKLMSFPTLIQNTATAEMLTQLVGLENQRAELLMTRTATDRDVRLLDQRIASIESELRSMAETYWRGLGQQVTSLNQSLAGFEGELARIPAQQMSYVRLGREASLLGELYTFLQTKQKEAEIAAAVQDQAVRVVDPAIHPDEPVRPKPVLSLLVALVLGLVLGVGGAVVAEHSDRTVRDRGDLQAATGATVLGLIPMIDGAHGRGLRMPWQTNGNGRGVRPRLVEQVVSGDPAAEAYRSLRTNINFARPQSPPRALVITSPMPGDGKSTTAANMALVRAQQGGRVLLVDADMRRGALNEVFDKRAEPGLSGVLVGETLLDDAIQRIALSDGCALDFLAAGRRPPNPAELLSSEPMARLLREAAERYDVIVLDAPPLNLVTDAALLGRLADGVLLVARAGVTEAEPLAFAVDQIARVQAPLLGTVLNGVDERGQGYYGSGSNGARGYFNR